MALSNPFAVGKPASVAKQDSAFFTTVSGKCQTLPPGLGASNWVNKVKDDPMVPYHRRVRNIASLETFGGGGRDDDNDDDDDEIENGWAKSYLSRPFSKNNRTEPKSPWHCRNCDRGFQNQYYFDIHIEEHEKCGVEGCPYEAHPKLVFNHYKTQHLTGLADKVWTVKTPEDIAKWREERRRKFPTRARIAQKKAEMRAKRKRGDVLSNAYFGKINGDRGRGRGRGDGRGRGRGRGGSSRGGYVTYPSVDKEFLSSDGSSDEEEDYAIKLKGEVDMSAIMLDKSADETDKGKREEAKGKQGSVLGCLASAYASSDEDVADSEVNANSNVLKEKNDIELKAVTVVPVKKRGKKSKKSKRHVEEKTRLVTDGQPR